MYEKIGFNVIESAIDGYNSTIFAYGQTSSGKTHTMMGTPSDKGIIREAVEHIYDAIEDMENERIFSLRVSFIEIYNEKISDLLDPKDRDKIIKVEDDADGNGNVKNIIEREVSTAEEVIKAMEEGQKFRHVSATAMNERSSRSHTIFCITIASQDKQAYENGDENEDGRAIKVSHLNLVDLAGSERVSQTGATGQTQREGMNDFDRNIRF